MTCHVRELSEARFSTMAGEWQRCLGQSDADPLFMSWPWLYSWWETWSQVLGLDLLLVGVFDESDSLIGLGPFFSRYLETPMGLRVRRLHVLGNAWRIEPTVRSEYSSVIARRGQEALVRSEIFGFLAGQSWDELVVCDITAEELSLWKNAVSETLGEAQYVTRSEDKGVRVDTTALFADWRAALGKNTRLKAFNRRRYLHGLGCVEFETAGSEAERAVFFSGLNEFHQWRWGKPAFNTQALNFHQRFIARLPDSGMQARCSTLYLDGARISVLYDIDTGRGRYNLQSGYLENLDPKLSLGTLHLGFAIEDSFRDEGCCYYDLLAGSGKATHYKSRFNGSPVRFTTVQLVRASVMRMIYRGQARLPQRFRQKLNHYLKL